MKHTNRLQVLAGLLLAGVLLGACAGQDTGEGGAGAGGAATSPTTGLATATTAPAPPTTGKPAPGGGQLAVTGTVREGVEPGCLLLEADRGGSYLLVGGDRAELRAGTRVQVTGRLARDLLSTCQQGEPLVVGSVKPAP
jgi:hypothetical protein